MGAAVHFRPGIDNRLFSRDFIYVPKTYSGEVIRSHMNRATVVQAAKISDPMMDYMWDNHCIDLTLGSMDGKVQHIPYIPKLKTGPNLVVALDAKREYDENKKLIPINRETELFMTCWKCVGHESALKSIQNDENLEVFVRSGIDCRAFSRDFGYVPKTYIPDVINQHMERAKTVYNCNLKKEIADVMKAKYGLDFHVGGKTQHIPFAPKLKTGGHLLICLDVQKRYDADRNLLPINNESEVFVTVWKCVGHDSTLPADEN